MTNYSITDLSHILRPNCTSPVGDDPSLWEYVERTRGGVYDFRNYVQPDGTGCVIWTGNLNEDGYGSCERVGEYLAHRAAWRLLVGPIPEGMKLDHLCRKPACVLPDHLEPVTNQENVRRGLSTPIDAELAQLIYDSDLPTAQAAVKFGVADYMVTRIRRGRSWGDVTGGVPRSINHQLSGRPPSDISGQRFGRLVARTHLGTVGNGHSIWLCDCDCGNQTKTRLGGLKSGRAASCGCSRRRSQVVTAVREAS